jgi:hypothetical protein
MSPPCTGAISGDDLASVRWVGAVDEARMAINALRRAVMPPNTWTQTRCATRMTA